MSRGMPSAHVTLAVTHLAGHTYRQRQQRQDPLASANGISCRSKMHEEEYSMIGSGNCLKLEAHQFSKSAAVHLATNGARRSKPV